MAAALPPTQKLVAADPVSYLRAVGERFDCVYLHPSNSYSFDQLPAVNWLAAECRRVLVPDAMSRVYAWGYQRMLELYVEFWLSLRTKLGESRAPVRMRDELLSAVGASSPLAAEAIRWFRVADFQSDGILPDPDMVRAAARMCALRAMVV